MAGNEAINRIIGDGVKSELIETAELLKTVDSLIRGMPQISSVYKGATNGADLKKATDDLAAANAKMVELGGQLTKVSQQQIESLEQAIAMRKKYMNTMESWKKEEQDNITLLKQGIITKDEYNKRIIESQIKIEQYKVKLSDANKYIKDNTVLTLANANSIGAARKQVSLLIAERDRLDATTEAGRLKIKDLNTAIDKHNVFIKENTSLLEQQKINVGNYAEGVEKGSSKIVTAVNGAWGVVRKLAYILPGVGIAGIFSMIGEGIMSAVKELFNFNAQSEESKKIVDDLTASLDAQKKSIDALTESINFLNRIGKINLEIDGFKDADLMDLRGRSVGLATELLKIRDSLDMLRASDLQLQKQRDRGDLTDEDYTKSIEENSKQRAELWKSESKLQQEQSIIYREIALQKKKDNEADSEEALKIYDKNRKAIFEMNKLQQEQIAEANRLIAEDQTKSLLDRLVALEKYTAAKKEIINLENKYEKGAQGLTNKEIELIDAKSADARIKLARDTQERMEKIRWDKRNPQQFTEAYEEEKVYNTLYDAMTERIKKFYTEKARLAEKDKQNTKKKSDLEKQLQNELYGTLTAIVDGAFQKRLNNLQDEEDAMNKKFDTEVRNISASTLTEQEKADKLKILEAERAAQTDEIEQRKRRIQQEQARFDKAANIAKIISDTAAAVIAVLKETPAPAGIPLAVLTGAIGAAQLAKAIATPIPKYAEGTDSSKEGFALTDERGPEMYIRPDGSMFMGNKHPTVRYLERGTKIIPYEDIQAMMQRSAIPYQYSEKQDSTSKKFDELKDMMLWQTGQLKAAYSNRKNINVNVSGDFKNSDYIRKAVYE